MRIRHTTWAVALSSAVVSGLVATREAAHSAAPPSPRTDSASGPKLSTRLPPFRLIRVIQAHRESISTMSFSPDGTVLASAGDMSVCLWDVRTGRKRRETRLGGGDYLWFAYYCAEGRILICAKGAGQYLYLLDASSLKVRDMVSLRGPAAHRRYTRVSPDGKLLAISLRGTVRLYDAATGRRLGDVRLKKTDEDSGYVAWAPDGRTIAVGIRAKQEVRLCDVKKGKEVSRVSLPTTSEAAWGEGHLETLVFAPCRKVLAVVHRADNVIDVCNLDEGARWRRITWERIRAPRKQDEEEHPEYPFLDSRVVDLAFSPDGKTLAVSGMEGKIRLWEVATGGLRHQADIQPCTLLFSPSGSLLATNGTDGTIRLWDWRDPGLARPARLTEKALDQLWADCASRDAAIGYRAIAGLRAAPKQSVELLAKWLMRVEPVTAKQLGQLVAELDDADFDVRERASERIVALGRVAEATLREAQARRPSLEMHKRIALLLAALEHPSPTQLRVLRSVEVLECLATPEARRLLARLASGAAGAPATEDARAAHARLTRSQAGRP